MTIKQHGGIFGRNPTFNNVTVDGTLAINGPITINGDVFSGLDYDGTWNASTNTPTLTSSVGTIGHFYIVSVAGSTNLNGITNWGVGDWAVFNGTVWQRVEGGADGNFVNLSVTGTATVSGTAEFADGLAASPSITNIGDTNTGMYFPSADAIGIVTGGVNRIRVTSTGDVGIGTTSPGEKLQVAGAIRATGAVAANTTGGILAYQGSSTVMLGSWGADASTYGAIQFYQANSTGTINRTGMLLDSAGNLGLGVTPSAWSTQNAVEFSYGAFSAGTAIGTLMASNAFYNGTNWIYRISSAAMRYTQDSAGHSWFTAPFGTSGNTISFTQAMTLDANGNLLVGQTSGISGKLQISGAGGIRINEDGAGTKVVFLRSDYAGLGPAIQVSTADPLLFLTNNTERMRITSPGDVGIGTSSPGSKLHVNGDVRFGNGTALGVISYSSTDIYFANLVTGGALTWYTNGSERMRIDSSGNVGIGTSSPSSAYSGAALVAMVAATGTSAASLRVSSANASAELYSAGSVTEWGLYSASNSPFSIWTNGNKNLTLDSSGNLGLGVTPSAWGGGFNAIQMTAGASFGSHPSVPLAYVNANTYFDGSNNRYINNNFASRFSSDGFSGGFAWQVAPSGTAGNIISFTQAMTLGSDGNLAVGSSSTGNARIFSYINDAALPAIVARQDGAAPTQVWQGPSGAERARITSSGDLLVGKTTASGTTVGPELLANGQINTATANLDNLNIYNTTAAAYRFYVNAAGTVFATNTTISAISDQRLKENVQDLDAGLDKIMALKPRKFDWKAGKGKDIKGDRGFIAQEFEQVFPDLIDEWKDPALEGEEPYKSVRQDLIPVLVKAIQELKAEVDSLKAQLGA